MPLATVWLVVPVIVAGAPYALQLLAESVPVCMVSVELASPDAVAVCVSV